MRAISKRTARLHLSASVVALASVLSTGAAFAQDNQMETVVVTGFRASLEKALDMKRGALDSSDSILAEDIAKFPDLNLSESLQRIPGVALERQQGEGREISVRGLSADFTRVRVNGMEALATTGNSSTVGVNRGRAFDFNMFASDLFSAITVHKSASADLEEGSLGATVDLHTAHPFDHPGFVFSTNLQGGYNGLTGGINPRVAALVSNTFLGGRLGILFSGAYGIRNTLEDGNSTVRFQNDNTAQPTTHGEPLIAGCVTNVPVATSNCSASQRLKSVFVTTALPGTVPIGATNTPTTQAAGTQTIGNSWNTATPSVQANGAFYNASLLPNNYDIVNEAFKARFPRYDLVTNHAKRLGLTGSIQWQPDDNTLFTLDGLYADYRMVRNEEYLEANSLSVSGVSSSLGGAGTPVSLGISNIAVTDYTLDAVHNNLTAMTANGVGLRAEHFLTNIDSRFEQLSLDGSHDFSNSFKVHGIVGWSESHMREPVETTLTYDYNGGLQTGSATLYNGAVGYSYDYTGGWTKNPALKYGSAADSSGNVTSLANWFISQMRERSEANFNSYRTAVGDFSYEFAKSFKLSGGVDYKGFGYRTVSMQRSNGTTANQDFVIPADIRAADLSQYSMLVSLKGLSLPAGVATSWMVPDLDKFNKQFDIWSPTAEGGAFKQGIEPALGSNGSVREDDLGFWLQADWDTMFYGVPFRGNIGGRYIQTTSESIGYAYNAVSHAVVPADVKQTYHNFLPAVNLVFEPTDSFLIRINTAQTLSRPGLTNMLPGASVSLSGANRNVSVGNPNLKPFTSKNVDLGFEWYYHKGAMLSIAMFYKHIDTFIQTLAQSIVYHGNAFGLPDSLAVAACGSAYGTTCNENLIWNFSSSVNTKGSPLYGTEINWQQPFDFLPDPLDSFGFLGNVTFVQAKQYYYNSNGTVNAYANLIGLSPTAFNATLYYDDQTFQARASAAFRSKYISSINPGSLNDQIITGATLNLDASASYKIDENFTVSLEGVNLTNEVLNQYIDSIGQRPNNWHQTGREFFVGIRYNY